jgi:hypothetical protein
MGALRIRSTEAQGKEGSKEPEIRCSNLKSRFLLEAAFFYRHAERNLKDRIIDSLAQLGWHKDRIVDAFGKTFETVVAPKRASIWLRFDQECNRWWLTDGDFTSAGENVLAGSHAIFPVEMPEREIGQTVASLVGEMEQKIAGAYSVRLLDQRG